MKKSSLATAVESAAAADQISRADLIETLSYIYLCDRQGIKSWVQNAGAWIQQHKDASWTLDTFRCVGYLRGDLETYFGMTPQQSMEAIERLDSHQLQNFVDWLMSDGTGFFQIDQLTRYIYSLYMGRPYVGGIIHKIYYESGEEKEMVYYDNY